MALYVHAVRSIAEAEATTQTGMATLLSVPTAVTLATTATAVAGVSSTVDVVHEAMPNRGLGAHLEDAIGLAGGPSHGPTICSFSLAFALIVPDCLS